MSRYGVPNGRCSLTTWFSPPLTWGQTSHLCGFFDIKRYWRNEKQWRSRCPITHACYLWDLHKDQDRTVRVGKGLGAGKNSSISSNLHSRIETFKTSPLYILAQLGILTKLCFGPPLFQHLQNKGQRTQCLVRCEARPFCGCSRQCTFSDATTVSRRRDQNGGSVKCDPIFAEIRWYGPLSGFYSYCLKEALIDSFLRQPSRVLHSWC